VWPTIRRWFDPDDVREVGARPDYRFSLANERTFLAWLRTGLALIGGGLAIVQFLPEGRLRIVLAVVLLALGGLVSVRAVDHWIRSEIAMRLDKPLPPSRFPAVLAIVVAVGSVLLLLGVLVGAFRT
jgi:putative membrane protein